MQLKSTLDAVLRRYPVSDLMSRHADVSNIKSQDSNSKFGIRPTAGCQPRAGATDQTRCAHLNALGQAVVAALVERHAP